MNRSMTLGVGCLVLVGAGCANDAAGPTRHPIRAATAATVPTHPAGVIVLSAPLAGRPYGVAVSSKNVAYITQLDASRLARVDLRSEEHTSELQSPMYLVCRLLLEKKKKKTTKLHLTLKKNNTHLKEHHNTAIKV